jgi:hypothetical protein
MRTIGTEQDFLRWAQEINSGVTIARKCDMQDIYAHTPQNTITSLFLASNDRKLLLCSIYNTMAYDEVERLLKELARQKTNELLREEQDDLDTHYALIQTREVALIEAKRAIYRKISDLEKANRRQAERIEKLEINLLSAKERNKRLEASARKFDLIKKVLA